MKVVCCTMSGDGYDDLYSLTYPNLQEYCRRHGYDTTFINVIGTKWEYRKHEVFERLFKDGIDLIWYKDVDSIITNMTKPITDFIDEGRDFFITEDVNELNGGCVILKNSEWGRWLNNIVLSNRDKYENEQNVYNAKRDMITISGCMKVLPHPSINSYDYSLYPEFPNIRKREEGHWHEGDFVLHTPGAPMEVRLNTLKNATIIR